MQRISSILVGVILVLLGMFALAFNTVAPSLGLSLGWLMPWRFWPMIILGVGTFLFLLALLSIRTPGLGALFIPAVPLNMVGAILLYASVFGQWHVWSFAWSLVVLAVAVGFLLAMIFSRVIWYGIPAILIGVNGLVLAFCSITGLWSWWSVLWTIEPLALGLVLLLVSYNSFLGGSHAGAARLRLRGIRLFIDDRPGGLWQLVLPPVRSRAAGPAGSSLDRLGRYSPARREISRVETLSSSRLRPAILSRAAACFYYLCYDWVLIPGQNG